MRSIEENNTKSSIVSSNLIILSKKDLEEACAIAKERMDACASLGLHNKHGAEEKNNFKYHILGARGEIALKKFLKSDQKLTVNTFKNKPDIENFEARTAREDDYDLILREDDPDHKIYILVVGSSCKYRIAGWIKGSERYVHEKKTFNHRPKAWFIPQSYLHDMNELKTLI